MIKGFKYHPDFDKVPFRGHKEWYDFLLRAFVSINRDRLIANNIRGLIFAFSIEGVETFDQLKTVKNSLAALNSGHYQLLTKDYVVLKLDDELFCNLNPIRVYFPNFFELLESDTSGDSLYRAMAYGQYTAMSYSDFIERQKCAISEGNLIAPIYLQPCYPIQLHLPWIDRDSVLSVYEAFDLRVDSDG